LQILNSTIKLLHENSIQAISIEAIAREAGVSKATIYRWWDSKALLVIDAFIENHLLKTPLPVELGPKKAIAVHFRTLVEQFSGWPGRILAQIIAEGQSDPSVLRAFRERFHYGRRAIVKETLEEWKRSGEIPSDTDVESLMDIIYSAVYMRLLVGHAPLNEEFAKSHIDYIYHLLGVTNSEN
jgi:AcrR family transcriptional regulator